MIDIETLRKAIALTQKGNIKEAKRIYEDLLKSNPDDSNLLSVFGLFYVNIGDYDKACEILYKAASIQETFGNLSAIGFAEYERRNYLQAIEYFEKALNLGKNVDIYNKLVTSLFSIKNYFKAIEYANEMFKLYPTDVRSIVCKIKALTQAGKLLEAEKLCVESIKCTMDNPSLWFQLGFLKELIYSDDKQAMECYKYALDLGYPEAAYNIAVSYQKLGEYSEAEKYYKQMLAEFPNDIVTITSLGMCYLAQKRFKEGYSLFFKRDKSKFNKLSNNFWNFGDNLDEEINIICDQGYGDIIQFIRYVPLLKSHKINIATRDVLVKLFRENYPDYTYKKYEDLDPNVQTLFITDLAYILDLDFDNIPSSDGYIKSEEMLLDISKPKVGICWEAGSAGIRTMINRTINIKLFEEILNLNNVQIYSFQVDDTLNGNKTYSQMINLAKDFNDFSDTAKALKAMDVVITVDTALAHLSGALGIKTYLLLPYATDWRWFSDTKKTPWYNSVEIFKQTNPISWENQISEITKKLIKL